MSFLARVKVVGDKMNIGELGLWYNSPTGLNGCIATCSGECPDLGLPLFRALSTISHKARTLPSKTHWEVGACCELRRDVADVVPIHGGLEVDDLGVI
jgi:hypothetical protein